jgi:DNA-binding response OmpR family regulator
VVADDRVARAAAHDELSDAFGSSVMAELSQLGAHPEAESHRPPEDGARRTVLVVDDEVEVRRMLTRLFSDRGFRVIAADRGLTALRLVKERSPDVIVLDAMLPEVHGFDIAKRIRGSRKYGHIPIVMISAYYRGWRYEEDVRAAYGVTAFIEKPFKMADILAAVDGALARADGRPVHDPQPDTSGEAEQALVAGIAAYKAGDVETAIGHLRRGVEIDPLAHRLHFQLGLLLGKRGQIFEAILALEKALETSPRHFQALKNLAVLYQKAGFRNQAIECWERALAHSPDEATRHTIKQHLLELL